MSEYDTITRELPEFAPSVVDTRTIDGTRVSIVEHHAARVDENHEPVVSGTRYEALIADTFTLRPPTAQVYVGGGRHHEAGDYAGGQWSRAVDLNTGRAAASLGGSETVAGAVTAAKRGLKRTAQLAQYGPVAERNIATFNRDEFAEFTPDQPIAVGDLVVIQSHGRYRLGVAVAVTATRVEALVATPSGRVAQGASATRSAVRRYTKTRADRAADVAATVEAYTGDDALDAQARATHVQNTLDRIEADVLADQATPAEVPAPANAGEMVAAAAALIDAAQLCTTAEAQRTTSSLRNPEKFFHMPADVAAAAIHAPHPAAGQVIGVIVCMWPGGGDAKCAKVGPFDSPSAAQDWWTADFNRFARLASFVIWPAQPGTQDPAGGQDPAETTGDASGPTEFHAELSEVVRQPLAALPDAERTAVEQTIAGTVGDDVWMSTARRGLAYHRPAAERGGIRFTGCARSMRTGITMRRLDAVERVGATPCPRCYPAATPAVDTPAPPAPVVRAPDGIEPPERRHLASTGVTGIVATITPEAPDECPGLHREHRGAPGLRVFTAADVDGIVDQLAGRADEPVVTRGLLLAAAAGGAGVRTLVDLGTPEGEAWVWAHFPLDADSPDVTGMDEYDHAETDYMLRIASYGLAREVASTGPGPWRDRLVDLGDLVWAAVVLLDAGRVDLSAQLSAAIAGPDLARCAAPLDAADEQVRDRIGASAASSLLMMWILDGADWDTDPEGDGAESLRELIAAGLVEPDGRPPLSGCMRWRATDLGARIAATLPVDEAMMVMSGGRPHPPTGGAPCPDWCPMTHLVLDLIDRVESVGGVPFEHDGAVYPGYVVGVCGHRVAASEWRAGMLSCERCPSPPTRPAILDDVERCTRCGEPLRDVNRTGGEWCVSCRIEVDGESGHPGPAVG